MTFLSQRSGIRAYQNSRSIKAYIYIVSVAHCKGPLCCSVKAIGGIYHPFLTQRQCGQYVASSYANVLISSMPITGSCIHLHLSSPGVRLNSSLPFMIVATSVRKCASCAVEHSAVDLL